jgi:hypothetical protein
MAACYLSLTGLDNAYFWDDEAFGAIMAKNILAHGTLTAWDGRNLLAYVDGAVLTSDLISTNPPVDNLVTAISFWTFGASTWAGRFPFVLFGLASLLILALLVKGDAGKDPWLCFYVLGSYAFSLGFLLFVRQCRYYALALFFSLLTLYLYRQCLQKKSSRNFVLIALSSVLLFHSNFLLACTFLFSLGLMHLLFYRNSFQRNDWLKVGLAAGIFALLTVPYAIYIRMWAYPDYSGIGSIPLILQNMWYLNAIGWIPWPIAMGLVYIVIRYRHSDIHKRRLILQWTVLGTCNVALITLLSNKSDFFAERLLIVSLPFLTGLTGICLWYIHQRNAIIAFMLFIAILTSNVMSAAPFGEKIEAALTRNRQIIHSSQNRNPFEWKFEWRLPAYLHEIYRDYPTAEESVARFLDSYASHDDLVYSPTPHRLTSLMFYNGDKVRICCILDKYTSLPRDKLAELDAPLFLETNYPNWIIAYGYFPGTEEIFSFFAGVGRSGEGTDRYYYRHVATLNIYWYYTQRPELAVHRFGPYTEFDSSRGEAVYIFRRFSRVADQSG